MRIVTSRGKLLYANKAILDIYGYGSFEELRDTPAKERYAPESYAEHEDRRTLREQGKPVPANYEVSIVRKDGDIRHLTVTRNEVTWNGGKHFQVIYQDITDVKKLQEQLIAQDRLASLGQLVSGVAHELNNPLTSVIGFSDLLLEKELPGDIRKDLQTVHDEAARAASIVKNLLTFARKTPREKQLLNINEPIQRVLDLRAYEEKSAGIEVKAALSADLPNVLGNGSQLQQVFMNIVINAEFFMLKAHGKGILTITTQSAGDSIRASFADDGPGIPKENMRSLFTPFFTTKGVGEGTGLGLSICQGIIAEHGGKMWAESEPGQGATFIIELPAGHESARA